MYIEARAEIQGNILLGFGGDLKRHQKDILKLTDLYM